MSLPLTGWRKLCATGESFPDLSLKDNSSVPLKLHLGGFLSFFGHLEEGGLFKTEHASKKVGGKTPNLDVIDLDRFVVTPAFNGNAVFGTRQLVLEADEIGICLKVWITLHDQ